MPAILIVAHAPLASALKSVAAHVYADCPHAVEALDVDPAADVAQVQAEARARMAGGAEAEWLVLTDVFGATPCNAMKALAAGGAPELQLRVLTGVSVPMLWRSLCYADESLDRLQARALEGARKGVILVVPPEPEPVSPDAGPT